MKKSCMKCIHYFSTFDPTRPRGCKLYGMKTAQFPNILVKKETGKECLGFQERAKAKSNEKKEFDLNDPRLW